MPAMVTTLTEFSDNGNSRTYVTAGHTVSKPKLVVQRRRVPTGKQVVQEVEIDVVQGTVDTLGEVLPQKVALKVIASYPIGAIEADIAASEIILRDIVASDEFSTAIRTQQFLS